LLKEAPWLIASALPATAGGVGGGMLARKILTDPRFFGRVATRAITAAGSVLGELIGQKAGINEPSTGALVGAGLGGFVGGAPKPRHPTKLTPQEVSGRRTMAAQPLAEKEAAHKTLAKEGFEAAINSADINTARMLEPLEKVIARESSLPRARMRPMTTESATRSQIVNELESEWATLGDHLEMFTRQRRGVPPTPGTPPPTPSAKPRIQTPERVQIPDVPASEKIIPSTPPKGPSPSAAAPAKLGDAPPNLAPGDTRLGIRSAPTMLGAENIIDDVQRINRLATKAESAGAFDLAKRIRDAVGELSGLIPGYKEATKHYAKSKGYGEAKKVVRESGNPANRVRTILEGKRSTTFSPKEKQAIIRAAEKGEGIGAMMSMLLRSKTGQQFLKAGITPDGKISNSMIHLGLQFLNAGQGRGLELVGGALMEGSGARPAVEENY
jgi:hypothetical protein